MQRVVGRQTLRLCYDARMSQKDKRVEEIEVTFEQVGTNEEHEEAIRRVFVMILRDIYDKPQAESPAELKA